MRRIGRSTLSVLVVIGLMLGLGMTSPQQPAGASQTPACAAELNITVPHSESAGKTPVLTVHGWKGDAATFSEIGEIVKSIEGVEPGTFDYESVNDRWVTDPAIGQRLAKTIICYSKLYKKPLILVAHSMGGLAVREALDWADGGVWARDVAKHVITIGTPHTGALPANADANFWLSVCKAPLSMWGPAMGFLADGPCRQLESTRATSGLSINSDQLAKLATFPPGVSVKAIAGDVSKRNCAPWGCSRADTISDLVVTVPSATNQFTTIGKGDGKTVFTCDTDVAVSGLTSAWCEHSNMLKAPQVQDEVKRSIEEYLKSTKRLPEPKGFRSELFGKMKLIYRDDWGGAMSEPDAMRNVVDNSSCTGSQADCPHIYFINMDSDSMRTTYGSDPVAVWSSQKCTAGYANGPVDDLGEIKIGGEPARHYRVLQCGLLSDMWLVKSRGIFIATTTTKTAGVSLPNLYAVFDHIKWL